ncbi:calcium-binding protein [Lentibacillus sp. L22]|uniref:calcium-binding protein n=1 Tax=Lentibacillus sp. L22 TaxID=3163028 RepID=UPI00346510AA
MEVTNEHLGRYYRYLQQHLTFPFRATYEGETGPLSFTEYELNCLQLDQEIQFEEFYGILVECREGRKKTIWELADIVVDEENVNYQLIDDYQTWFWNYR